MEVIKNVSTPESEKWVAARAGFGIQFIVTGDPDNRQLVIGSDKGSHVDLMPDDAELIGAGTASTEKGVVRASWGSNFCKDDFGFDKPSDPVTADTLLENVRVAIASWLSKR